MDFDKSYISGIEFLVPASSIHVILNSIFMVLHSIAMGFLLSSIGDPYRAVIEELTADAARNGTVLTVEEIMSTDQNPIPSEFAANPVFVIALIVSVGLHVLFYLAQKWSVSLRIRLQYRTVKSIVQKPTHICVYPPQFRGKPEIIPLGLSSDGARRFRFDFQRRKFEIVADTVPARVDLLSYPLNVPIGNFLSSNNGIVSPTEVGCRQSMYGMNMVDIPVPPFYKLYLEQLLSPIPIFQLFCSALWMMDEYWKYTLFTLLTIFGFEVSTTVQRKKSLETLRSMSGKVVVPVLAKRGESLNFVQITSEQLVPGDRIRLLPNTTVVPCDSLIVAGSVVVNEASLTGESIPQMKDAVDDNDRILDISDRDKVHCLFSGTCLIRYDSNQLELIVVRTGSQSSQGELLRMVEFSQQQISSDKKDTMCLLLLLLTFAIAAASYVVYERVSGTGSENLTKMKTHKLVLRVIMIITSVVPPELPLQMSLAVNTALMALHKIGIFCTEPFRVPMAGSVTHCFFDKTGTLTSDKLECHSLSSSSAMTQHVVAGCHSLIEVEGKILGDPVEQTALEFTGWKFFANENKAVSPDGKREVKIVHRFHFSSQLQRMSCVVTDEKSKIWAVVKGSPEVIFERLANRDKSRIQDLTREYEDLAHAGKRVLALGYKALKSSSVHRDEAETELEFAGFAAFGCETRADTLTVINALSVSAQLPCVMVTGDALLTAVHVAKDTGILTSEKILRLEKDPMGKAQYVWREISIESQRRMIPFVSGTTEKLSREFGLVVSGSDLPPAPPEDGKNPDCVWTEAIPHIRVFARMSPIQKEQVIGAIRTLGGHPLMCGDGGNDVGALKQADVGVALLAGFGAANTSSATQTCASIDPEDQLEEDARIVALKEKRLGAKMKAEFEERKKILLAKQQEWMNEELSKPGNAGYWSAIKAVTSRLREELARESKSIQAKYGSAAWDKKNSLLDKLKDKSGDKDHAGGTGLPVVQMGDASVAAPFTSRAPSIRSVVQIIRQGRCTLLVAVQMMQIMMLESLISAYTFAAITMEGGRSTEIQLIGSSMFVMVASIAFTYAKPNKKLSSVIPLKSVFSRAIFFSVVAQVLIHLAVLVYAMSWAKSEMGQDALQSLYDFERDRDEKLTKFMNDQPETTGQDSENWLLNLTGGMDMLNMFKSVPYRPNLLNTVMFLVKTSQQVSVLVVNYKGSPWMQGALENKALFLSMFACAVGIVVCSTGYIPWINQSLELMVLPDHLRNRLLGLLAMSTVGAFVVDRLIVFGFAREIFVASTLRPLINTKISDFLPIVKTCAYMAGGVLVLPLVLGNPIGMIAGFYAFKMYKKWKEDRELAELEAQLGKEKIAE